MLRHLRTWILLLVDVVVRDVRKIAGRSNEVGPESLRVGLQPCPSMTRERTALYPPLKKMLKLENSL